MLAQPRRLTSASSNVSAVATRMYNTHVGTPPLPATAMPSGWRRGMLTNSL